MAADALDLLTRIAKETSLRYAMHMIMTGALCCRQRKGTEVELVDIRRVYGMFSDLRRSTQYLIEYNKQCVGKGVGGCQGGLALGAPTRISHVALDSPHTLAHTHDAAGSCLTSCCSRRGRRRRRGARRLQWKSEC